jgi:cytochrome c
MKRVIFTALLATVGLMAAESAISTQDGAVLYVKKCAICHGANADKTPIKNMKPIAGMEAEKLAKVLKFYQDDERIGHGYSQEMVNTTTFLSQKAIDAIALYVSTLK